MVAGTFMIAAGSVVLFRIFTFLTNADKARATVHSSDGHYSGKMFRYRTQDDNYVEVPTMRGTLHYRIGEEVPIFYHAHNPKTAFIKHKQTWWLMPSVTAIAGVAFALMGLFDLIGKVPL